MSAWVGLGGNIGDRAACLWEALKRLSALPGVGLLRWSSLYESEPWGVTAQPAFLNAVAEVDTGLGAPALLRALHDIETAMGRRRDDTRWRPSRNSSPGWSFLGGGWSVSCCWSWTGGASVALTLPI